MHLEVVIDVICDADLRQTNSQIEQSSKELTLDEVVNNYAECDYRRGLILGWDQ